MQFYQHDEAAFTKFMWVHAKGKHHGRMRFCARSLFISAEYVAFGFPLRIVSFSFSVLHRLSSTILLYCVVLHCWAQMLNTVLERNARLLWRTTQVKRSRVSKLLRARGTSDTNDSFWLARGRNCEGYRCPLSLSKVSFLESCALTTTTWSNFGPPLDIPAMFHPCPNACFLKNNGCTLRNVHISFFSAACAQYPATSVMARVLKAFFFLMSS